MATFIKAITERSEAAVEDISTATAATATGSKVKGGTSETAYPSSRPRGTEVGPKGTSRVTKPLSIKVFASSASATGTAGRTAATRLVTT